ncbi:MAG: hypothetical protein ACXVCE_08730 [Bacteriovorax sp.]
MALNPNGGNVGIGTTSPVGKLEVAFTDAATVHNNVTFPSISNTSNTAGAYTGLSFRGVTNSGAGYPAGTVSWDYTPGASILSSNFHLRNVNSSGNFAEVLTALSNGNIGIGTANPDGKLTVDAAGGFVSLKNITGAFLLTSGSDYNSTYLTFNPVGSASSYATIGAYNNSTGAKNLALNGAGGNVGIGTTSPGAKLEVAGGAVIGTGVGAKTTGVVSYFTSTSSTALYIHIRTPFKPAVHTAMYLFKVEGYSYADSKDVDLSFVGYSYPPIPSAIQNLQSRDPQGFYAPAQYIGSDGYIYLRFKPGNTYYLSFRVDSTYVGNGRIVYPGEMVVTESSAATL